jgi:hypothetical protein
MLGLMNRKIAIGRWLCGLALLAAAPGAEGAGFEVAVFTGPAIPTYKQTLKFAGGSPQFQLARLSVRESPSLDAEGGLSLGASATIYLSNSFGFEGRFDSLDVDLVSFGGDYSLELGAPGSPVTTVPITLGSAETDLKRVRPLSLNLKFQSQGRVGVGLSAGVSYLPDLEINTLPTLTVANLSASLPISLTATPVNPEETRHLGFNGGLTVRVRIAGGFAILAEARGFAFRRSQLRWEARETGSLSAVEKALLASIVTQLELPQFTPGFWTARAGVSFRF